MARRAQVEQLDKEAAKEEAILSIFFCSQVLKYIDDLHPLASKTGDPGEI